MSEVKIHDTAFVEKGAELDHGVEVGPFCLVSAQSKIAKNTKLRSHVVFEGSVTVGSNNVFDPFCVIGGLPQDFTYKGEDTKVLIGEGNTFRESVTVHRATAKDEGVTRIENHNYLMAYSHVAHDCHIANHTIIVNQVQLAGHVAIGNYAIIGGQSAVAQFCRLGDYAFLGGHSVLRKDLPPFMAAKNNSEISGPNIIGLRKRDFSDHEIRIIKEMYKIYYRSQDTKAHSLRVIGELFPNEKCAQNFINFVKDSRIGGRNE